MHNLFSTLRKVAGRLGAIGAALLLVALIGGLVVGLILVHRGGTSTSSPAAVPISVYVGSADGSVYKLNAQQGTLRWQAQISSQMVGDQVVAPPVVVNGSVYVSLIDGMGKSLVALDAANGSVRWRGQVESKIASEAVVANGIVYVTGGSLYAFSASNGALRWRFSPGSFGVVTVDHGLVYVTGGDPETGILYALDASSGAVRWQVPTPETNEEFFAPEAINGVVYISLVSTYPEGGRQKYYEYAFNDRTGALLWKSQVLEGSIASSLPALADGRLSMLMDDGSLVALSAATGAQLWRYQAAGGLSALPGNSPWVVGQAVYIGYGRIGGPPGRIVALNTRDGSLRWQQAITNYTGTPFAIADGMLYVGSSDGIIHALRVADGAQVWQYKYFHATQDVSFDPTASVTAAP